VSSQLPSDLVALQVPVRVLQHRWTEGSQLMEQVLVEWSHMLVSLATWNVSNVAAPSADEDQAPGLPEEDEVEEALPRPKRTARPNSRVYGPEWSSYMYA
jgi:hypothetical protein